MWMEVEVVVEREGKVWEQGVVVGIVSVVEGEDEEWEEVKPGPAVPVVIVDRVEELGLCDAKDLLDEDLLCVVVVVEEPLPRLGSPPP